jgi:hypothetical protein
VRYYSEEKPSRGPRFNTSDQVPYQRSWTPATQGHRPSEPKGVRSPGWVPSEGPDISTSSRETFGLALCSKLGEKLTGMARMAAEILRRRSSMEFRLTRRLVQLIRQLLADDRPFLRWYAEDLDALLGQALQERTLWPSQAHGLAQSTKDCTLHCVELLTARRPRASATVGVVPQQV